MDDWTLIGRVAPFRDASAYAASSGALNLSQGLPEPLFDNAMNAALARQVRAGWQYADPRGEMILRESIAGHNAGYAPDTEVLVTSGCTEALYLALYAASTQYGSKVAFLNPSIPITQEWPHCWGWSLLQCRYRWGIQSVPTGQCSNSNCVPVFAYCCSIRPTTRQGGACPLMIGSTWWRWQKP